MTEFLVSYDPRTKRIQQIERAFNKTVARRSPARFATPLSIMSFLLASFGLRFFVDTNESGLVWLLPPLVYLLIHDAVRQYAHRRAIAARDAAPLRNRPSTSLKLGPDGVVAEGAFVAWHEIIEVMRLDDATMLLTLPYQALVLPDEALPAGVTPDVLLARIAEWKAP